MALSTMQQRIVGGNNGLTVIMTVYLIWQGTDSHAHYMQSHSFTD